MNASQTSAYRVLARRYRPHSFSDLIGQETLVQTLSNALALGRLAHAFVLTGVRGVGKTSTARIIAKGLNCIGPDGTGGPTLEPCGTCEPCQHISEGRHVDVLEMDAASHTGVEGVRDIIDGAAYRPVSARFKIYIIDEVHMLSNSAFNALLKTLEEPADSVKFIFATTEIRKVPVTILSRCQRFDLRRVPADMLASHIASICEKEDITFEPQALKLIAGAAEGSVRDALSLLDQAAAMSADKLVESTVVSMLGQADMAGLAAILLQLMQGEIKEALHALEAQNQAGAEPLRILGDMLGLLHQASLQASGATIDDVPENLSAQLDTLSSLGIARLGRAWQILLNGQRECQLAPNPAAAVQMLFIRLAHIAPMPTPAEIMAKLPEPNQADIKEAKSDIGQSPSAEKKTLTPIPAQADRLARPPLNEDIVAPTQPAITQPKNAQPENTQPKNTQPENTQPDTPASRQMPADLRAILKWAEAARETRLAAEIRMHVRLNSISPGDLDISLDEAAPKDLPARLAKALSSWTEISWMVSVSDVPKDTPLGPSLADEDKAEQKRKYQEAAEKPNIKAVLDMFKGSYISDIKEADVKADEQPEAMGEPSDSLSMLQDATTEE
ncbi:MAG: DNA polymerase III subunit gamma/tau [Candidatus Puniceispirillaceae bacterium]